MAITSAFRLQSGFPGRVARVQMHVLALYAAAPAAALAAGLAAEWLDFRALRVPLLVMVGFGVVGTAAVATRGVRALRAFAIAVLAGVVTWSVAEAVYCIVHVALGERFEAERFGPQPMQALGLIAAHGVFLGAPTGAVAGVLLVTWRRFWKRP
jgi:hypothetical protein